MTNYRIILTNKLLRSAGPSHPPGVRVRVQPADPEPAVLAHPPHVRLLLRPAGPSHPPGVRLRVQLVYSEPAVLAHPPHVRPLLPADSEPARSPTSRSATSPSRFGTCSLTHLTFGHFSQPIRNLPCCLPTSRSASSETRPSAAFPARSPTRTGHLWSGRRRKVAADCRIIHRWYGHLLSFCSAASHSLALIGAFRPAGGASGRGTVI